MSTPPKKTVKPPSDLEVFYLVLDGTYWMRINGRFVPLKKSDLRIQLTTLGISEKDWHDAKDGRLDAITWVMWNAQEKRMIDYAGSLAGHRVGVFKDGSNRQFLVTDEAAGVWDEIPDGKKIPFPEFFNAFLEELLPNDPDGGSQIRPFLHWLAVSLRSMRAGDYRPGQCLCLCGPVECGKSLLQDIVTEIFGGRVASPERYMMDKTSFNKDLAGAEHWKIEEPKSSTKISSRVEFGNALKECFNNADFSIHPKGKEAITLKLFRRGTISVNNDPELMMVLPPLNSSNDDKLMLFDCAPVVEAFKPFTTDNGVDREAVWKKIKSEIPIIRAWLLRTFPKVPAAMRNKRFGVAAYHHPTLKAELISFTPEARLLSLIDEIWNELGTEPVVGRANEIEILLRKSRLAFQFDGLLQGGWKLGNYLGKLAKVTGRPDRVSKECIKDGYTTWRINPPPSGNESKPT